MSGAAVLFSTEAAAAGLAFRQGAASTARGWAVLLGRSMFYVVVMVVISRLWDTVMAARLPGTLATALPPGVLVLYVGATEWIALSLPSVYLRLEDDIRLGGLEAHLLRPKAYLAQVLAQALGGGVVRLAVLGVTALGLLAASGRPWPPAESLVFLLVLGPLGLTVGVLLYALAGLSAFWARRTLPFFLVVQKLMFLAGGLFAPVSLYPGVFRTLAEGSPFAAHLYWTGRQLLGPSLPALGAGVAWSLVWIVLLSGLCAALWRAGLARVLRQGV